MRDITPTFHPTSPTAIINAAATAPTPHVAPEFDFKGKKVRVVEIEGNLGSWRWMCAAHWVPISRQVGM